MKGYNIYSIKSYRGHTVKTGACKLDNMYGVFVNDKLVLSTNDVNLADSKAFDYFLFLVQNIN